MNAQYDFSGKMADLFPDNLLLSYPRIAEDYQ
jgi:hypothetical protein